MLLFSVKRRVHNTIESRKSKRRFESESDLEVSIHSGEGRSTGLSDGSSSGSGNIGLPSLFADNNSDEMNVLDVSCIVCHCHRLTDLYLFLGISNEKSPSY